jgi:hypothetical protein
MRTAHEMELDIRLTAERLRLAEGDTETPPAVAHLITELRKAHETTDSATAAVLHGMLGKYAPS